MFEINLTNIFNKKVSPLNLPQPQHSMIPDPDRPGEYKGIPFIPQPYPPVKFPYPPTSIRPPFLPDKNFPHKIYPPRQDNKPDQTYIIPDYPVTRAPTSPILDLTKSNPTDLNKQPISDVNTTLLKPIQNVYTGPFTPPESIRFTKPSASDISIPFRTKDPNTPNKVFDIGPVTNTSGSPGSPGAPITRKKKSTKSKSKRKVVRKVVKKVIKKCKCKK